MTDEMRVRRLIRMHDVAELLGVHRTTIYDWIRAGKFPQPVPVDARMTAFFEDEVVAWQKKWDAARRPSVAEGEIVTRRS